MQKCPKCQQTTRQNKAGHTEAGSQRYRCMHCGSKYTPEPKQQGYPDEVRKKALEMYVDGINLRRIGRHFGIHHQTVANWVKAYAAVLPETPMLNYSPLSAIKKQGLRHHDRRPSNSLLSRLECGLETHQASHPRHGRLCTQGQDILQ